MLPIESFFWIPAISILLYIPVLCWLDIKYREIPHRYWEPFLIPNVPVLMIFSIFGAYDFIAIIISLVAISIYFMAMRLNCIQGADFVFLAIIALFFQINPLSGNGYMQLPFMICLACASALAGFLVLEYNWLTKNKLSLDIKGGIPYMIIISAAFIMCLVIA